MFNTNLFIYLFILFYILFLQNKLHQFDTGPDLSLFCNNDQLTLQYPLLI